MEILSGILEWNIVEIASALKISVDDVEEYFTDGRRISFILERRLSTEIFGGKIAESEGANFDLVDDKGRKWEVRSISGKGTYFCPSYMVGSGRSFNEEGFINKLDAIEGYILCDIEAFPKVPFFVVSSLIVRKWWIDRQLGNSTKVSRKKILGLIQNIK